MHSTHRQSYAEDCVLVIAESESSIDCWMRPASGERIQTVAIFQQPDETRTDFAHRTVSRLSRLMPSHYRAQRAIFALQPTAPEGIEARMLVAEALLRHLCETNDAELALIADRSLSDEAKHELFGIVEALTRRLNGSAGVRLQFVEMPTARARLARVVPPAKQATDLRRAHYRAELPAA